MEIRTKYGNELDIGDSIFLTSVGDCEGTSAALSFYNHISDFGISYFVEGNKIVFQNDYSTDYDYWTKDRVKIVEKNLENFIHKEVKPDEELNFDLEMIVEYILFEMDMYSRYLKNECPCCGCCL